MIIFIFYIMYSYSICIIKYYVLCMYRYYECMNLCLCVWIRMTRTVIFEVEAYMIKGKVEEKRRRHLRSPYIWLSGLQYLSQWGSLQKGIELGDSLLSEPGMTIRGGPREEFQGHPFLIGEISSLVLSMILL